MLLQASHVASESACTLNLPQSLQSTCTRPDNNRHNRHNAPCPAGRPAQPAAWVPDNDCPSLPSHLAHLLNGHMRCRQLHVRVRQRDICRHPRQARQADRPDSPRGPDGQVEQCPRVSWPNRPGKVTRPRAQAPPARLAIICFCAPLVLPSCQFILFGEIQILQPLSVLSRSNGRTGQQSTEPCRHFAVSPSQ